MRKETNTPSSSSLSSSSSPSRKNQIREEKTLYFVRRERRDDEDLLRDDRCACTPRRRQVQKHGRCFVVLCVQFFFFFFSSSCTSLLKDAEYILRLNCKTYQEIRLDDRRRRSGVVLAVFGRHRPLDSDLFCLAIVVVLVHRPGFEHARFKNRSQRLAPFFTTTRTSVRTFGRRRRRR